VAALLVLLMYGLELREGLVENVEAVCNSKLRTSKSKMER
jgi:hypothetical protein